MSGVKRRVRRAAAPYFAARTSEEEEEEHREEGSSIREGTAHTNSSQMPLRHAEPPLLREHSVVDSTKTGGDGDGCPTATTREIATRVALQCTTIALPSPGCPPG